MRTGTCDRCGAEFVDRSQSQRRRFCSDNCRKRKHEVDSERAACLWDGCDRMVWPRQHSGCCREHSPASQRKRDRAHQIEAWWAEGLTFRQIAARLGWSIDHFSAEINRLRREGYNLPYRRTAAQVENIRRGTRAGLGLEAAA